MKEGQEPSVCKPMKKTMSNTELESLDKLQRIDHDTLIRLESKVDSLITDIRDLKDGTSQKLTDHETRLRVIEKIAEQSQPETNLKKLNDLYQWKHDFQVRWQFVVGVAGLIGGVVGFVLTLIGSYFNLIGK